MKKEIISIFVLVFIAITGIAFSKPSVPTLEEKLYQNYLSIKNALVDSDMEKVKASAEIMLGTIKEAEKSKSEFLIKLKPEAEKLTLAKSLDDQRIIFSSLTEKIYPVIKGKGIGQTTYYQFCPMALNNKGGFWLSESKEIRNPYFGDMMLKCGSTKETITSK